MHYATATVNFPALHLLVLGSNGAQISTLGLQWRKCTPHSSQRIRPSLSLFLLRCTGLY